MQRRGYPSVPSPAHPHAGSSKYLSGGYNTRRYCPGGQDRFHGFQLECPKVGVRDTEPHRKAFAVAFVDAVIEYLKTHARLEIRWAGSGQRRGQ